jgi:hypothetical protein
MVLGVRFKVEPIYSGRTVIIVAGGPSLSLEQTRLIARARHTPESRFRVIAINDAIYPCFWADWLHACDLGWWTSHIQHVHMFPGIKTTLGDDVPAPWVTGYLKDTGPQGFDPDPTTCRTGGNSAYQAMHIAIHTGADRIILAGVDMQNGSGNKRHWFGDHEGEMGRHDVNFRQTMIPHFDTLKPALEGRHIDVINANPGSALHAFRIMDLQTALLQP